MFFGRSSFITIIVCSFFDFYSVLCFFPQFLSVFFFSQHSSFRVFIRKDDDNKIGAFHLVLRLEVHIVLLSKAIHRKRLQSTHTQNEASKKSERKSYRRKIKVRKSFARTPRSIVACPYSLCCDLNASTVFYDWQCPCSETMPIFFFDLFALSSFLFFPPSVTLSHTRKRWRRKKTKNGKRHLKWCEQRSWSLACFPDNLLFKPRMSFLFINHVLCGVQPNVSYESERCSIVLVSLFWNSPNANRDHRKRACIIRIQLGIKQKVLMLYTPLNLNATIFQSQLQYSNGQLCEHRSGRSECVCVIVAFRVLC